MNPLVVRRKLQKMLQYLNELESIRIISLEDYLCSIRERRAVERLIQLIVDVAVDLNTHMVVDAGFPAPDDARTSFFEVGKIGFLPMELVKDLAPSAGERNIIVHQYEDLDDQVVYNSVAQTLRLYREYVRCTLEHMGIEQP